MSHRRPVFECTRGGATITNAAAHEEYDASEATALFWPL